MKYIFIVFAVIFCTIINGQDITSGKISGYMFGDYFYNISRDSFIDSLSNTALTGKEDINGFQLRRIYFTYDYKISEKFDTRFRLEADQSARTTNGRISVFVKDAYLRWKNIFNGSDLIFGIQPLPAFEISELVWGYRSLEKTILDFREIVSSRDLGASLKGSLASDKTINYWITIGNGGGVVPETDKYKRFYAHLYFNFIKNLHITLYSDLRLRPSIKAADNSSLNNNDLTSALFIGYKENNKFSIGLETFIRSRQNGNIKITEGTREYGSMNSLGVSFFGSYDVTPIFGFIGRFDFFDPNIDTDFTADKRNFYLLSFRYNPDEKISIIPNVLIETFESLLTGRTPDASVTGRITLFYQFL